MKKIFALVAIAACIITACKKKTDDPAPGNNDNTSLVGAWNIDSLLIADYRNDTLQYRDTIRLQNRYEWKFTNDSLYTAYEMDSLSPVQRDTGYYMVSGSTITVILSGDTTIATYTISNSNQLAIYFEDIYENAGDIIKETSNAKATRK